MLANLKTESPICPILWTFKYLSFFECIRAKSETCWIASNFNCCSWVKSFSDFSKTYLLCRAVLSWTFAVASDNDSVVLTSLRAASSSSLTTFITWNLSTVSALGSKSVTKLCSYHISMLTSVICSSTCVPQLASTSRISNCFLDRTNPTGLFVSRLTKTTMYCPWPFQAISSMPSRFNWHKSILIFFTDVLPNFFICQFIILSNAVDTATPYLLDYF